MHSSALLEPASTWQILRYIFMLHLKGLSPTSIRSKLSAITNWHHIHSWENPTDQFIVRKALLGAANLTPACVPPCGLVMPAVLVALIQVLKQLQLPRYNILLFRAMCLLSFFAFLRISEYTDSRHNLASDDVILLEAAVKVTFRSFKFSRNSTLEILLPQTLSRLCPFTALSDYITLRPPRGQFFFVDQRGVPIKPAQVHQVLRAANAKLHSPPGHLTPHSFRIGAATTATAFGYCAQLGCQMNVLWGWIIGLRQPSENISDVRSFPFDPPPPPAVIFSHLQDGCNLPAHLSCSSPGGFPHDNTVGAYLCTSNHDYNSYNSGYSSFCCPTSISASLIPPLPGVNDCSLAYTHVSPKHEWRRSSADTTRTPSSTHQSTHKWLGVTRGAMPYPDHHGPSSHRFGWSSVELLGRSAAHITTLISGYYAHWAGPPTTSVIGLNVWCYYSTILPWQSW